MSASLVGSEMCIRDRPPSASAPLGQRRSSGGLLGKSLLLGDQWQKTGVQIMFSSMEVLR
eukprot:11855673-Alexandrium_andersonii.AAC.1